MGKVNIDLTSASECVNNFYAANNRAISNYSNLTAGIGGEISRFGIVYFSELEAYMNSLTDKNVTIWTGASSYITDLRNFQSSIKYTPSEIPSFGGAGKANGASGISNSDGDAGDTDNGGDINDDTGSASKADGDAGDTDNGGDIDDDTGSGSKADGDAGDADTGGDINDDTGSGSKADGDAGDADAGGDINDDTGSGSKADGDAGDAGSGGKINGRSGGMTSAEGQSKAGDAGSDITQNEDTAAKALGDEDAEALLADLLAGGDISSALGGSTAAGLKEALTGPGAEVAKSGLGLGALAAVIGTIAAGGAGLAGALGGSGKGNSLGGIANDGKFDGKALSGGAQSMMAGIVAGAGGMTAAELLGGSYPEALANGMNALDMVMNVCNEAGPMSNAEMEFAMMGEPYAFRGLTAQQKEQMFLTLGSLIDKYGGVDGFVDNPAARALIQGLGDSYDILKDLAGKSPEEVCAALRGLLDRNNPNINGVPISKEARDVIVEFLQNATGLSIDQLLDGTHNQELMAAFNALLDMLKAFKAMSLLSKEELRQYLYDLLNGCFPELCGINPFSVRSFKDYMIAFGGRLGCNYTELYTIPSRTEGLRGCIKEFGDAKYALGMLANAMDIDVQETVARLVRGEMVNIHGVNISPTAGFEIKSLLKTLSLYRKCAIDALVSDPQFKDMLTDMVKQLYKYSVFQGMFATLKPEMIFERVNNMMKGTNFGLLGFNFLEIETIKKANEQFAVTNKIQVNDLLNNNAYAPKFREYLINNDSFIKLMLIFDGLSDGDIQLLIHNLMVGWDEDFRRRLQNLINYANKKRLDVLIASATDACKNEMRVATEASLSPELAKVTALDEATLYGALKEIYEAKKFKEKLPDELIYLIRLHLLILSISQKISVKDMLALPDGKELVRGTLDAVKCYPNKIANTSDLFEFDKLGAFVGGVLMGAYPEIIGYDEEKKKAFVDRYYKFAASKGVNIKDLLTAPNYSKEVASAVAGDQSNRVIAIFVRELNELMTQRFINTLVFG